MPPNPARSSICRRRPETARFAMTVLTAEARRPEAREVNRAGGIPRRVRPRLGAGLRAMAATFAPSTPFQDRRWLDAWYRAFAGFDDVEPLIAIVSDAATSEQVALFPLVRRVQHGASAIVEFADHNLTDYNAPLLHAAAPRDAAAARLMWRDLLAALKRLPGGTDLVRLRKMPFDLDGRPNPLTLLDGASASFAQRQCGDDRRRFRRLPLFAGAHGAQGTGTELARVHAPSRRGVPDRDRARRGAARAVGHGNPAGCADAASRAEVHAQRRNLRRVLSRPGQRKSRQRLCRAVRADGRRGSGRDPARDPQRLALCDGADQQCRREMVELFAGPADHRTHHGGAASAMACGISISASAIMPTSAGSAWCRWRWPKSPRR